MPNLARILKDEIRRLAKKEVQAATGGLGGARGWPEPGRRETRKRSEILGE